MCSSTEDFEGRGQVFVEIWRGRSWPREYHIDANSIRLRQVIDVLTCGQHYIYIYIVAAPPKILKVGGRYL